MGVIPSGISVQEIYKDIEKIKFWLIENIKGNLYGQRMKK